MYVAITSPYLRDQGVTDDIREKVISRRSRLSGILGMLVIVRIDMYVYVLFM